MPSTLIRFFVGIAFIAFLAFNALFIVEQRQTALVLQFGQPMGVKSTPGLHFKIPFIQNLVFFDNRILDMNATPKEVTAFDQKRLIVDAFLKFKIEDPLLFYQAVRSESRVKDRLNSILESSLRQVLGSVPFSTLLTGERSKIMGKVHAIVNKEADSLGINVVDLRIMRTDLPKENSEAIYRRMQTERDREAKEFRAEGAEEASRIMAKADKERMIILSEAKKLADISRGKGEGKSAKIFSDAFGKDADFFAFYRAMQAYKIGLQGETTSLLLSTDSDFMKAFKSIQP